MSQEKIGTTDCSLFKRGRQTMLFQTKDNIRISSSHQAFRAKHSDPKALNQIPAVHMIK